MTDPRLKIYDITGGATELRPMSSAAHYRLSPATDAAGRMWEELKQPWSSTPQGRLAIRTLSRGVLGAIFYAWGAQKAVKDMSGYNADNPQNTLQHIARIIDKTVGMPMVKVLNKMGLKGEEIVSFRPSHHNGVRSLGEDAIFNTFDFAAASAGDALGREIIGLFDPAVEKRWRGEDGKIHFPEAVKSLGGAGWRIFRAQAEDWFVAIPYTFQQKFQRKLINKISPGFEVAGDTTLHGSSFKLDKDGNIIGTYAWEGALDLQGRFTGYNFGTAIFRDLSRAVENKFKEFTDPDAKKTKKPERITPETLFDAGRRGVRGTSRYLINRVVKTMFVMTPSIPIFSLLRIPQSKHRGIGIMPDGTEVKLSERPDFKPYDNTYSGIDTVLNPLGKAAYKLSNGAAQAGRRLAGALGKGAEGQDYAAQVSETYVNAAISYTPYIYAKNEFAHHWDNPDMDVAVNRVTDGLFHWNFKEVKAGIQDVRHALKFRNHKTVKEDEIRHQNRRCEFHEKDDKENNSKQWKDKGQENDGRRKFADRVEKPFTLETILNTPQNSDAKAQSHRERMGQQPERYADRFNQSANWQEQAENRSTEPQLTSR